MCVNGTAQVQLFWLCAHMSSHGKMKLRSNKSRWPLFQKNFEFGLRLMSQHRTQIFNGEKTNSGVSSTLDLVRHFIEMMRFTFPWLDRMRELRTIRFRRAFLQLRHPSRKDFNDAINENGFLVSHQRHFYFFFTSSCAAMTIPMPVIYIAPSLALFTLALFGQFSVAFLVYSTDRLVNTANWTDSFVLGWSDGADGTNPFFHSHN